MLAIQVSPSIIQNRLVRLYTVCNRWGFSISWYDQSPPPLDNQRVRATCSGRETAMAGNYETSGWTRSGAPDFYTQIWRYAARLLHDSACGLDNMVVFPATMPISSDNQRWEGGVRAQEGLHRKKHGEQLGFQPQKQEGSMSKRMLVLMCSILLIVPLLFMGCGSDGSNGSNGSNGTNGTNGTNGKDLTAALAPESCSICHNDQTIRDGDAHQADYDQRFQDQVVVVSGLSYAYNPVDNSHNVSFALSRNGVPFALHANKNRCACRLPVDCLCRV